MRTNILRRAYTLLALLGLSCTLAACENTFHGAARDINKDAYAVQRAFNNGSTY
ncbi:MAG TPA: hypothetical protein VKY24_05760 [Reyranella sp.]|nr:hypothetical protein [Reyranella sp.]